MHLKGSLGALVPSAFQWLGQGWRIVIQRQPFTGCMFWVEKLHPHPAPLSISNCSHGISQEEGEEEDLSSFKECFVQLLYHSLCSSMHSMQFLGWTVVILLRPVEFTSLASLRYDFTHFFTEHPTHLWYHLIRRIRSFNSVPSSQEGQEEEEASNIESCCKECQNG